MPARQRVCLVDTDVISEAPKKEKADRPVATLFEDAADVPLF
jgi:hypothetical protein